MKPDYNLNRYKTKKGFANAVYNTQVGSSKKRGHRSPEYSKLAFYEWLMSQTLFHTLYEEWVQSGYETTLKPSIDRKENDVHYCMTNIRLMTWGENRYLFHSDVKNGKSSRVRPTSIVVIQKTKGGSVVNEFPTICNASIVTGIAKSGISRCVKGKRNSAGGFKWSQKGVIK